MVGEKKRQLRFAILARVSTPKQKGDKDKPSKEASLEVQRERCEAAVAVLGGKITARFVGQEHATPGNTRLLFDTMEADAKAGKFDALIFDDITRFGRANDRAEQALGVLRKHRIKVYIGTSEYDLADPANKFFLTMGVGLGEMYAVTLARKSIQGKVKRAKAGIPSSGALPWGRRYDKLTRVWSVDEDKKKRLEEAAEDFLRGATLRELAPRVGVSTHTLIRLFREKAGDTFPQRFDPPQNPELAETVQITVPPLLTTEKLRAIAHRLNRGPGFFRENIKRHGDDFLLRGMIFCKECGYALSPNVQGPYYSHQNGSAGKPLKRHFANVPASLIEERVMEEVFNMLGDVKRRRAAIEAAYKGLSAADAVRGKIEKEQKRLAGILSQQERLVDKAAKGILSDAKIKSTMDKLEEEERAQRKLISELQSQVSEIPTKDEIEAAAEAIAVPRKRKRKGRRIGPADKRSFREEMEHTYLGSAAHLKEMSFEERRDLLRLIFGYADKPQQSRRKGVTVKFTKGGVYLTKARTGHWSYRIKGLMLGGDLSGTISLLNILNSPSRHSKPTSRLCSP